MKSCTPNGLGDLFITLKVIMLVYFVDFFFILRFVNSINLEVNLNGNVLNRIRLVRLMLPSIGQLLKAGNLVVTYLLGVSLS